MACFFSVAPNEHKVRIEVGYGLEGTLTDALASVIISSAIIPRFKAGDFSGGIEHGVDGIISVLDGDSADWQPQAVQSAFRSDDSPGALNTLLPILGFLGVALVLKLMIVGIAEIFQRVRHGTWRFAPAGHYVQRGNRQSFRARAPFVGELGLEQRFVKQQRFFQQQLVRLWFLRRRRVVGRRRRIRELVMQFDKDDYEAVAAAIGAAEKKTSGQIVCVLAHSSSGYVHVPILWAVALALFTPWPLIDFTQWSVQRIFLLQLVVFIVAGLIFSWMPLRLLLVPRAVQRARAHRAAIEQFVVRGISRTKNRTGVLIFVSLAEHYARIIADDGIAAKVPNTEWQAAIDALTAHMRADQIAAGFTAAIERCGEVLAQHAPPDGSPNELPDRLYIM